MEYVIKSFSLGATRALCLLFGLMISALASSSLMAVDCTSDHIELSNQAGIDSFQSDYGGGGTCDTVPGTLRIGGPDVVDLTPLSALTTVRDQFQIRQTNNLIDLDGLSALTSVGGDQTDAAGSIDIFDNAVLTNFNGLSGLASVGGTLSISGNAALTNLDGFSALTSVGGLSIWDNDSLTNLSGISALVTGNVPWSLALSGNDSLTHLDDLSGLTGVGGNLSVTHNDTLANLDGLSALTNVARAFDLRTNPELVDVDGLSALAHVGGFFQIIANSALTEIDGLSSLASTGGLRVKFNAILNDLDGLSALENLGGFGRLEVSQNASLTNLDGLSALREAGSVEVTNNTSLGDCQGIVMLVDPIDDFEPGPGPGSAGVPDVLQVKIEQNLDGCNSVPGILGAVPLFEMNAGLNDTWFNLATNGQGFFFIVFPEIEQMFMAWFTYDTERPPQDVTAILGEPGHRWLTAQGGYEENVAQLDVFVTAGGVFDSAQPAPNTKQDGEIMLEFSTCNAGTVTYDIPSVDRQGVIPIERIVLDNVPLCYVLNSEAAEVATRQ
jgi:hypothetical protein